MRFRVTESPPKPPASSSSTTTTPTPSSSSRPPPPALAARPHTHPESSRPHPAPLSFPSVPAAEAKKNIRDDQQDAPSNDTPARSLGARAPTLDSRRQPRENLKSIANHGLSARQQSPVRSSTAATSAVHSEAPPPHAPLPAAALTNREVDQKSDSGSSISTEAYNSEDEHGVRAAEVAAAAAAEVAGGLASTPHLNSEEREELFRHELEIRAWRISEVRADGNCLFRALAYAAWGDEELHGTLRARIMDYVVEERDYFSQFVAEDFPRYVRRKRRDGTHGNHLELQAAADLFGSRIEVYAYSLEPCAVITPAMAVPGATSVYNTGPLLKLSFHRGSHYNAVVGATPKKMCPKKLAVAAAESTRRRNLHRAQLENAANNNRYEDARIATLADTIATEEELEQVALELSIAESHKARLRIGGAYSSGAGSAGRAGSSSSSRPWIGHAPFQEGLPPGSTSSSSIPIPISIPIPAPEKKYGKPGPSAGSSSSAAGPSHPWRDNNNQDDGETR